MIPEIGQTENLYFFSFLKKVFQHSLYYLAHFPVALIRILSSRWAGNGLGQNLGGSPFSKNRSLWQTNFVARGNISDFARGVNPFSYREIEN